MNDRLRDLYYRQSLCSRFTYHAVKKKNLAAVSITISMAQTKDFFLSVTQRIFSNWTALKMCAEEGSTGSKERAVNFCPYIADVIYMNDNLSVTEISEVMEDYMEDNFQAELADGSIPEVAEQLLKFYQYCTAGNEAAAQAEMEKLLPLQAWILSVEEIRRSMHHSTHNNSSSSDDEDTAMETAADEWQEVKGRRKK